MPKTFRLIGLTLAVALVGLIAWQAHMRAVNLLPIDFDEDDYLAAGQRYAAAMRARDLQAIIDYEYNYEHPPLTKLVYGLVILPFEEVPLLPELPSTNPPASKLPEPHFRYARMSSAIFGTLEAVALAIFNPLAGLMLAIHTWQLKYTSQIMLEPLPALTSLLCALAYVQSRRKINAGRGIWSTWILLSAIFLGITAAGKFTYCVVGIAILIDWGWRAWEQDFKPKMGTPAGEGRSRLTRISPILVWGMISVLIFFAFDPRLWSDPVGRLTGALLYHGDYAQSEHVRQAGYPAWQPLVWLAMPVPWHPGVFQVPVDFITTIFATLGFARLWRRERVFALWLGIALLVLLFWPTKWPQYILILTAPLALSAAEGFTGKVWEPTLGWLRARWPRNKTRVHQGQVSQSARAEQFKDRSQLRQALPWLLPGLLALAVIALFPLLYQGAMALTDFNAISIKDGIQGGVWRAVRQGLSGQEEAIQFDPFDFQGNRSKTVRYAGPMLLLQLFLGAAADILVFNVLWTVLSVLFQAALGVAVALALNQPGVRLRNLWRTIFILPWAIPEFVGALVWLRFFEPDNGWLALSQQLPAGVDISSLFENPSSILLILLVAATWYGFPIVFLAATAGLKLIPVDVYDAAAIDGAGRWHTFRHVTWPLLLPLVAPALIIRSIFAFNQFYLFYTLQPPFPLTTFATISYYFFSPSGFFGGQFAVSAAINIFTVIVLIAFITVFNRWSKAAEGVTYA